MINTRTFKEIREEGRLIVRADFEKMTANGEITNLRVKMNKEEKSTILFGFLRGKLIWTKVD